MQFTRKLQQDKALFQRFQKCNATKAQPLQAELHYARIADYEGVLAMEASCIQQGASEANKQPGAGVASGGEGWLYFWDIPDPRWRKTLKVT